MTALKIDAQPESAAQTAEPPPFGRWVSDEARRTFETTVKSAARAFDSLEEARAVYGVQNEERLVEMRRLFPIETASATLGGVPVDIVTPQGRAPALRPNEPVLICLHGGGFAWGAGAGALLEAAPIAVVSGMTVVAVDYRMAPEHVHPAALEDIVAVYRALLAGRPGAKIGFFGCSAGAVLVAQAVSLLQTLGEPRPGATAMMHAAGLDPDGDLMWLAPMMNGDPAALGITTLASLPYFNGADPADAHVFPGNHPQVLAGFPPSLLITSTRDFAASSVSVMHRRLLAAGAEADFILFDGLWHAFHMAAELPESRELFDRVSEFFQRRLA